MEGGYQRQDEVLNDQCSLSLSHFSIILLAFISILEVFGPTCLISKERERLLLL